MDMYSLAHTKWDCKYHLVFAPKWECAHVCHTLFKLIAISIFK